MRSQRFTEAMQAAAVYDTYSALPADGAAHTATDVALLAEILKAAEAELDAAGQGREQQVGAGGVRGGRLVGAGCWVGGGAWWVLGGTV